VLQFRTHVMADAPSGRLNRTLTRMVVASIVTAGIAVLSPPSSAQQSPAAAASAPGSAASASPPATTPNAAASGFQSQGIKATITTISLSDNKIIVQFIIQNTRQSGVYLAIVGGSGGSAGTLMATNGAVYKIKNPDSTISGLASCYKGGYIITTDQAVEACLKNSDEHDMAMVEAGQTVILGIIYSADDRNKSASQTDNVSFALKFLVRSAPGNADTLSAAAAGKPGPPSVVTISFPLIPLASQ